MIEVIETALYSARRFGVYKKAWIIKLQNLGDSYKAIILTSYTTYHTPVSRKRWKLKDKFLKEGCNINKRTICLTKKKYRKKYWLTSEELIRICRIDNEYLINSLRQVEKEKS
jgi:hypothetical protein